MKVTVILENEYIISLSSDENGKYEIDENTFDFEHLDCYKVDNNKIVLDEVKYQNVLKDESVKNEISELEQLLNNSDYIIARVFEEVMSLNNPLTFIADLLKIFIKYKDKYKEQLANRVKWRERIEELRK